ncbi:hypothetical protein, partial [Mangrovicoccus sp. HB161399]|uniref:hypothetical protein n=1 Tax=Mangrovicoccus sp. HB161399 TaxID=2720392 RepID=UPI001C13228D
SVLACSGGRQPMRKRRGRGPAKADELRWLSCANPPARLHDVQPMQGGMRMTSRGDIQVCGCSPPDMKA